MFGVVTVLTASSVDIAAHNSEDSRAQHAQIDETANMHAKVEVSNVTSVSEEAVVAPN
jgi:hypothetical protein